MFRIVIASLVGFCATGLFIATTTAATKSWCGEVLPRSGGIVASTAVALSGMLSRRTEWGPPGFGHNPSRDSKFTAWILVLDYSVPTVQAPREKTAPLIVESVQLRGALEGSNALEQFLNRHVIVHGFLWDRVAPSDVTPIIMDADDIRAVAEVRCDGVLLPPKL